jgi:hypothetical protein
MSIGGIELPQKLDANPNFEAVHTYRTLMSLYASLLQSKSSAGFVYKSGPPEAAA